MKYLFQPAITSVFILLCLCQFSFGQANEKRVLRILCYNIHHGQGVDGKLDIGRIAKVILSVKPDLVALQEVDVRTERSLKVDQAKSLSQLTGMNFAFGKNIEFGGGGYGNCVLSRFPITQSRNHLLPNHRNGEQRGLMTTVVQPEFMQEPIHFWLTHFDHRRLDSERIASAEFCNKMLGGKKGEVSLSRG